MEFYNYFFLIIFDCGFYLPLNVKRGEASS